MWVLKGIRDAIARVKPGYEWVYVYGFCDPQGGGSFFLLMPKVNIEVMNLALDAFKKYLAEKAPKRILLVIDRAGWHTSEKLIWPEGIEPVYLPPKSPELQPAERLWRVIDEVIANHPQAAMALVEALLAGRCCWLMENPEVVRSCTNFGWWPAQQAL